MNIFTDKRLEQAGFIGGTFSRHSGNMREVENRAPVFEQLHIPPERMLHFHQIHSTHIVQLSTAQAAQAHASAPLVDADAWLFSPFPAGWGATITTADCVPLFLWDQSGTHAALAHCGWRGVVAGLPHKTAQLLLTNHPSLHLCAWIGPHIQSCCFEVQEDVATQVPSDCIVHREGKTFIDLTAQITHQLIKAGLRAADIKASPACTCSDAANFFSWRRDHEKNLLLSFIYKF